jgi:hypothetical protein
MNIELNHFHKLLVLILQDDYYENNQNMYQNHQFYKFQIHVFDVRHLMFHNIYPTIIK